MAYQTLVYLLLVITIEIKAKPTKDDDQDISNHEHANGTIQTIIKHDNNYFYNATESGDNDKKKFKVVIKTNDNSEVVNAVDHQDESYKVLDKTKCEMNNYTFEDLEFVETKKLDSVYLNNIYSSVTTNLIEEKVSIDNMEIDGVNLYDIVGNECGGANVCPNMRQNWTTDKTITIGFLGAYRRSQTVLGAMPLAVAAVNREPSLLPGLRLRFVAADIGPSRMPVLMDKESLSLRVMTQMRDLGVVAFFGPDGNCHTEARLASAWNLPLISHKCAGAHNTRDKGGLGSTFARTLPPAYKVSKSVVALLKAFGWTQFAIVAGDDQTAAAQQMDAIKELAQLNGMSVTSEHRFSDYIPRYISKMETIVDQTYDKTRIYVFLGEHIALVDFVRVLQRRGLLAKGEYAVVAIDDEIYDPSTAAITHAEHLGQNTSSDILAFRAVLKLTPSFPTNPHYAVLCQMIRALSAAPPFCVPNYHKIFEDTEVPIEAAHLYDAVTLWARAATAAMRSGLPPTDGSTLMKLLRPTTYRSVQGFDTGGGKPDHISPDETLDLVASILGATCDGYSVPLGGYAVIEEVERTEPVICLPSSLGTTDVDNNDGVKDIIIMDTVPTTPNRKFIFGASVKRCAKVRELKRKAADEVAASHILRNTAIAKCYDRKRELLDEKDVNTIKLELDIEKLKLEIENLKKQANVH